MPREIYRIAGEVSGMDVSFLIDQDGYLVPWVKCHEDDITDRVDYMRYDVEKGKALDIRMRQVEEGR